MVLDCKTCCVYIQYTVYIYSNMYIYILIKRERERDGSPIVAMIVGDPFIVRRKNALFKKNQNQFIAY